MKAIARYMVIALVAALAVMSAGCVKDDPLPGSAARGLRIHLVSHSAAVTKATYSTEAGEGVFGGYNFHENDINEAWVYLFPAGSDTSTPAVFASGKITTLSLDTDHPSHCDKIVTINISDTQKRAIFGSGTTALAYVIVNLPSDSEAALSALGSTPTVSQLKAIEISATASSGGQDGFNELNFGGSGEQAEFVMDSEMTTISISDALVYLKRAASKVRLYVSPGSFTTAGGDTYAYRGSEYDTLGDECLMKVSLNRGVTRSALDCETATGGAWRSVEQEDYFSIGSAYALELNPDAPDGLSTNHSETYDGKSYYTHDVPLYSYSTDWGATPARSDETWLTLMVPWYINGASVPTPTYYRVMIDSDHRRLQRNWYYKIYLDIQSAGNTEEPVPTEINISYLVIDWTREIMNYSTADLILADLQKPRYLSVEHPTMELHQSDGTVSGSTVTFNVPFRSSHDCVMSDIRAYSEIYQSTNWMAHSGADREKRFKNVFYDSGNNEFNQIPDAVLPTAATAQKSYSSGNDKFSFSIIAPSDSSDVYNLQVTAPAFTNTYMPIYVDLTLHHELVDYTDDTYYKQFYQVLSITLLPNISYCGEFSGGQMNYPEYTSSAEIPYYLQSQQPWVLVNGFGYPNHHHLKSVNAERWNVSGDILDYNWGFMRYTGGDGVYPWNSAMSDSGSAEYNNIRKALGGVMPPMSILYFVNANDLGRFTSWMPIITVAEAPEGTFIGDPRQHTSDLLTSYNNENSSTRTMTQFMRTGGWVYAPDANTGAVRTQDENYWIYSTTEKHDPEDRKLEHYYPTAEDEATMSVIAPKLRVASSWADTKPLSYVNAKRRCASYQEKGIPAGRWRLPTKAEMQLICEMTMNSSRDFPPLLPPYSRYNGEVRYWYAGGMVRYDNSKKEFEFIDYDFNRLNKGYNTWTCQVRPVYDEWFWPEIRDFDTSAYGYLTANAVQDEESRTYYKNVVVYKIREFKWGDMKIW